MKHVRTYLDWNATAPLGPEARAAMIAALDLPGNPSSVHAEGRQARGLIEQARESVAALVNARPSEVVFTSGATEANVWALSQRAGLIAFSVIEHDSVRAPALRTEGHVLELPVSRLGLVSLDGLAERLAEAQATGSKAIVALQMANNETGVIQSVAEAQALARAHGALFHTDAAQAVGRVAVDFRGLEADTLALSSHKIGGPKGVGALVVRDRLDLAALIPGGGQERRRRAGTEAVAAIAGFGAAADAARRDLAAVDRVRALRDRLEREICKATPLAVVVGGEAERLPNTSCLALPGASAEALVIKLDLLGLAVSAGAACSSGKVGSSRVLAAMQLPAEIVRSGIRVSLGRTTTDEDVTRFIGAWKTVAAAGSLAA